MIANFIFRFAMKKELLIILCCLFFSVLAISQQKETVKAKVPLSKGFFRAASVGAAIPIGSFSTTHIAGVNADFSISKFRFGKMPVKPVKSLSIAYQLGIAHYIGKKETVSGYNYKYPGYTQLHIYPGLLYNPDKKMNMILSIGPVIGFYNGNTQFNLGSTLSGTYYFRDNIGITPSLLLTKESGANPLMAVSLRTTLAF
jgi:hypothetical protein